MHTGAGSMYPEALRCTSGCSHCENSRRCTWTDEHLSSTGRGMWHLVMKLELTFCSTHSSLWPPLRVDRLGTAICSVASSVPNNSFVVSRPSHFHWFPQSFTSNIKIKVNWLWNYNICMITNTSLFIAYKSRYCKHGFLFPEMGPMVA